MRFFAKRGFDGVLIALAIATAFCMLGPALALIAALTIIGLPITLLMAATPPIFFFLLTVRLAMFAFRFRGGRVAAVAVAAGIFTAVPWFINQTLDATARSLASGDQNAVEKPVAVRSLAVVSQWYPFNRNHTPCDDFCMRALLSGSLDRVLMAAEKDQTGPLDPQAAAISFRMERRSSCPTVNLQSSVQKLDVDSNTSSNLVADPAEIMRLEIASGNCLIEEPARLGDAEAVARIGHIKQGETPYSAGLDLFADTVRADRISYWNRGSEGFEELYRWTGVQTYKLLPVLAPSYVTGYGLEIANGFLRVSDRINIDTKFYEAPSRTAFFTETLGFNLALDASTIDELRTVALNQQLDTPGNLDGVKAQVAEDFFQSFIFHRKMTQAQAEQRLRILADHRIAVPRGIYVIAQQADKMPEDVRLRAGDVLMARLLTLDRPVESAERSQWDDQASSLSNAIRYLPASAVARHRDALERIARREELRVPAWQALIRLADFGAGSVPTFLYLIEDAERFHKDFRQEWQHPYLAGLIGICKLGPVGGGALDPLYARLDRGLIPMNGSYGELAVNTLVAIGGEPESIWQRVLVANPKADRKRFDFAVSRAKREPDCTY